MAQVDSDGRLLLVSDCYCYLVGRPADQIVGTLLQDLVYPEDLPVTVDGFIRVFESGESRVVDHRFARPDGTRVWVGNTVSAVRDAGGRPQYVVVLARNITHQKETERALARSRADLRMIIDSAAEGVYCIDRSGLVTLCNTAFLRMLGYAHEEEVIGRDIHMLSHHTHPDGSPFPLLDCPVFRTAQSGVHAHLLDDLYFRRDGTPLPVESWARPIVRESEIEGAVCTFVDTTERKQAEARQQLLIHEMAHRVKNTIAMVQAIVGQSLRTTPVAQPLAKAINQRLVALGGAHSILINARSDSASIVEIVENAIAVHRSDPSRIHASGPKIDLGGKAALGITLALHELCTNASKYGALSNESGSIAIDWSITGGAADARFRMRWKESGGPPVSPPSQSGFGSRLIAHSVGLDLKGETKLSFEPDGVAWELRAPLHSVTGKLGGAS